MVSEGVGGVQAGELVEIWEVLRRKKDNPKLVHMYTDAYTVFKRYAEWFPF